jgi:hypothetical protein
VFDGRSRRFIASAPRTYEGTISLARGLAVAGSVVTATGRPVTGARINVGVLHESGDWHWGGELAVTDAMGIFVAGGRSPGEMRVRARAAGYAPVTSEALTLVPSARGANNVVLVMGVGAAFTGRVVDDRGIPVAGARVEIGRSSEKESWIRADGAGLFRFEGFGEKDVAIQATYHGLVSPTLSVRGGETVELILQRRALLRGLVRDAATGFPVPEFRVYLKKSREGSFYGDGEIFRNAAGVFTFADLEPKMFALAVCAEGYAIQEDEIELASGERRDMVVELSRGTSITGAVIDEEDQPIAGARVLAIPEGEAPPDERKGGAFFTTDRDGHSIGFLFEPTWAGEASSDAVGRFVSGGNLPGAVRLLVEHEDYLATEISPVEVIPGEPIDIGAVRLKSGSVVDGRVYAADGEPYDAGRIEIRAIVDPIAEASEDHGSTFQSPARAPKTRQSYRRIEPVGQSGRFRVRGLIPGRYRVEFFGESDSGVDIELAEDEVETLEIRRAPRAR